MIYAPKRFVFIHIPRTGGNSIHSAVATSCVGKGIDVMVTTTHNMPGMDWCRRHAPARELKPHIPDWDDIYKFTVSRPVEDIIESAIRLVKKNKAQGKHLDPTCTGDWKVLLEASTDEVRSYFETVFLEQLKGNPVKAYTTDKGEDLGVEVIPFDELNKRWSLICDACKIPQSTLPHLNRG